MSNQVNMLFYLKRSRANTYAIPIYLRVTTGGKRFEVTTNRLVQPQQWSSKKQTVRGTSSTSKEINDHLELLRLHVYQFEQQILREGNIPSPQTFREKWFGRGEVQHTLMEAVAKHNNEMGLLVGKDFKRSTLTKYKTTEKHLQEFIQWKYGSIDLMLSDLKIDFIKDLEYYLQNVKNLSINSRGKVLSNLKKIVADCTDRDWLKRDPFHRFHVKHVDSKVPFLTGEELRRIEEKSFSIERLSQVKDIFIFSCYTGFAYIDVVNLTQAHLQIDSDGVKWLQKDRQKTNITESVPVLPQVDKILSKYASYPKLISTGRLLPMISNQKLNAYLKEIADACDISIRLTFHIARHTFATTITLNNGVPIETVSFMMGHKRVSTTQVYAKVTGERVLRDMEGVRRKYI